MGWFGRYRKQKPASLELSDMVFKTSVLCSDALKPALEEKFEIDSSDFCLKYLSVMFEFMYFFLHVMDRLAFDELAGAKRDKLIDTVAALVLERMVSTYFGQAPAEIKESARSNFFQNCNRAQDDYGSCEEILLNPQDDTRTLDKLRLGLKSKSVVGRLTDNLSRLVVGEVNTNAFFEMQVVSVVTQGLRVDEAKRLMSLFSQESK